MDADCHEEEEVVAVSDWMDCTKLLLEAQHLWETVSLCVVFQIIWLAFLVARNYYSLLPDCFGGRVSRNTAKVHRCYS